MPFMENSLYLFHQSILSIQFIFSTDYSFRSKKRRNPFFAGFVFTLAVLRSKKKTQKEQGFETYLNYADLPTIRANLEYAIILLG